MNQNEQMLREALLKIMHCHTKNSTAMLPSEIHALCFEALAAEPAPLVRLTDEEYNQVACESFRKYAGWKFHDALAFFSNDLQDAFIAKNGGAVGTAEEAKRTEVKAEDYLKIAAETLAERGKTFDSASKQASASERSMGQTVAAFNAVTRKDLTESEGWLLMLLLKQVRQWSSPTFHDDSALDAVAYSALLAESLSNSRGPK